MGFQRVFGVGSSLVALFAGGVARAQAPADHARAEALSEAAVSARASGETEQECSRLEASARVEPTATRLLALADCNERLGKTATAWATYGRAAVLARRDGMAEEQARAQAESARLEPALTRLSVVVPDPHQLVGLEVFLDGVLVEPSLFGVGVAVDPGTHEFVARAPRHVSWSAEVGLPAAPGTVSVTVPMLGLSVLPPLAPAVADAPSEPGTGGSPERDAPGATQRTVGWVLGGAGAAMLAGGVVAAVAAKQQADEFERRCGSQHLCSAGMRDDLDRMQATATVSNVLLVGGALSLGAGVLVYVLAPAERAREAAFTIAPVVAPGSGGFVASGRF